MVASLEQGPELLHIVDVGLIAHVLTYAVTDHDVTPQTIVGLEVVGEHHGVHVDPLVGELAEVRSLGAADYGSADLVAFAVLRPGDDDLADCSPASAELLVGMFVLLLAAPRRPSSSAESVRTLRINSRAGVLRCAAGPVRGAQSTIRHFGPSTCCEIVSDSFSANLGAPGPVRGVRKKTP